MPLPKYHTPFVWDMQNHRIVESDAVTPYDDAMAEIARIQKELESAAVVGVFNIVEGTFLRCKICEGTSLPSFDFTELDSSQVQHKKDCPLCKGA